MRYFESPECERKRKRAYSLVITWQQKSSQSVLHTHARTRRVWQTGDQPGRAISACYGITYDQWMINTETCYTITVQTFFCCEISKSMHFCVTVIWLYVLARTSLSAERLKSKQFLCVAVGCFFIRICHAIPTMWNFVEVAVFFRYSSCVCIYKLSGRVWARGSLNSSSTEELWIKCSAMHIMGISIYKLHAQQQQQQQQ